MALVKEARGRRGGAAMATALALAIAAVAGPALLVARPAEAWNPLKPIAAAARRAGRAIGGVAGSVAGGFVESATAPTIHNVESSGRRLVGDVEDALGRQVDRADGLVSKLVGEVDQTLGTRLEQVDRSLEARILQTRVVADELVDRTFGRLEDSIGRVDDLARRRIDQIGRQVGRAGKDLIERTEASAAQLLAKADKIVEQRLADVRQLVSASLQQADAAAAARIEQLDEVAGRRIGSLDVIVTKQSLGLEAMLLRLAALIGMVVFLAFVLWRLFDEASKAWSNALQMSSWRRVWAVLVHGSPRFFIQVGLGLAGIAALYFLSGALPRQAEDRAGRQLAEHQRALALAFDAYDFTGVRYHATQLELLQTGEAWRYRAMARKAELLRTTLGRPALLQSISGVRQLVAEIAEVERALGEPDADILTLQAFVTWRIGTTRRDEAEAAALCARALRLGATRPRGFLLEALARNYLRAFLHDPYPAHPAPPESEGGSAAELAALGQAPASTAATPDAPDAPGQAESPQFQHILEYNALVARLDVASADAYLDLLDAQADLELALRPTSGASAPVAARAPAAAREARERRNAHAARVVEAWRSFDADLVASPWLADEPIALGVFTLDDSVLSRALYFTVAPEATELPPAFFPDPEARGARPLSELVRVKTAPIRVAWARRYASLVGPRASELLALEEAKRFRQFEQQALAFERAYVAFALALRTSRPASSSTSTSPSIASSIASSIAPSIAAAADAAIRTAAQRGLMRGAPGGRRSVASLLGDALIAAGGQLSAEQQRQIAESHQLRRIRFL